jgi:hypothetical protein
VTLTSFIRSASGPRRSRRAWLGLTAALILAATVPGTALAAGTLDQSMINANSTLQTNGLNAQTFTVGMAGTLDAVDLFVYGATGSVTIQVNIYGLNGSGLPTGLSKSSGSATVTTTAQWNSFTLSPGVAVAVGDKLAISFLGSASAAYDEQVNDGTGGGDQYPGGQLFGYDDNSSSWFASQGTDAEDVLFKTYVTEGVGRTPDPCASPTPTPQIVDVIGVVPDADSAPTICATPPPTSAAGANDSGGSGSRLVLFLALGFAAAGLGTLVRRERRHSVTR